ncbi:hypothetical protein BN946_scf184911.g41 [Trametes cinnabarina]|uniref:TECPR1-like DysF domain-containing protein n=1 Tax=Pycnoporus cinnabarinus TaxID=5643 RepID=A0A060SBF3_PYCCI|nr:hypothetical protein BN946_scf184911.g41 [Trametes cinnabarina]
MSEASSLVSSPVLSPAGPSSFLRPSQPPPGSVQKDDYAAADEARRRLSKRGLFSSISLPSFRKSRRRSKAQQRNASPSPSSIVEIERAASESDIPDLVNISESSDLAAELDKEYDKDVYRWAILYENQRGAMVFSTPYYSALTLLPLDPPPFTVPTAEPSPRKKQPTVTLEDYPLPDGSWKWVSRAWMIDMRGDGQVQYDGFEYSSSFRSRKWGPDPGFMSHRGLVRRRRWIRLMMRPAQKRHDDAESVFDTFGPLSLLPQLLHEDDGATRPPSVVLTAIDGDEDDSDVWKGDESDWDRCHAALRRLERDGRKLELWARWLGVPEGEALSREATRRPTTLPRAKGEPKRPHENKEVSAGSGETEAGRLAADTGVSTSKASKDYVAAVVRAHVSSWFLRL